MSKDKWSNLARAYLVGMHAMELLMNKLAVQSRVQYKQSMFSEKMKIKQMVAQAELLVKRHDEYERMLSMMPITARDAFQRNSSNIVWLILEMFDRQEDFDDQLLIEIDNVFKRHTTVGLFNEEDKAHFNKLG